MKLALTPAMERALRHVVRVDGRLRDQLDLFNTTMLSRLPANTARALLRRGLIERVPDKQQALAFVTEPYESNMYVRLTDNGRRRVQLMRLGHCHHQKEKKR